MKNRPSVTDEEIRSYMNFDSVVNQYKTSKKSKQNVIRNTSIVLCFLGISFLAYVYWPATTEPVTLNTLPISTPIVKDSAQSDTESLTTLNDEKKETTIKKEGAIQKLDEVKTKKVQGVTESVEPAFYYTEAEPEGGYPKLYEYFAKELHYPAEALKDSVQGITSVSFIIDQQGKPVQITIVNSLGPAFDQEAQRLIENMTLWKPATLNGKAVSAKISMPFTFQIVKPNPEKK